MPGVPGRTNNPNGRPPKSKSLTTVLDKALGRTLEVDGRKVSGKRVLANLVAEALTTGRFKFPGDETVSVISVKDWIEFAKWAYQYLEPPAQRVETSGPGGGAIEVIHVKPRVDDD